MHVTPNLTLKDFSWHYLYLTCIIYDIHFLRFKLSFLETFFFFVGSESPQLSFEVPNVLSSCDESDDTYQKVAEAIIHHSKESAKGKEISAPYEVPHFPIEKAESRRAIQRQLSSRYIISSNIDLKNLL